MTATIYRTTGTLTGYIAAGKDLAKAQAYLTDDDMTQYLEGSLKDAVLHIEWHLHSDGHAYDVTATAHRELTEDELKELASWVSGQNSDGLGEGFEQQDFAEEHDGECGDCDGCRHGYGCDEDCSGMISFDWESNKSEFVRVK